MTKEQTKKIFLGAIGLVILLYVYFSFFLGPLNKSRRDVERKIADTQAKLASSKEEMTKTARLEENARAALERHAALRSLSPEGAPIAWFPPRLRTFFAGQHIDKASARLEGNTPMKEKELEKWSNYTWIVDLPQADFNSLGRAFAALENDEPLLTITKLSIHASAQEPELQQVAFTASTLIGQR